jgi:hypothetical protein
VTVQFQAGHSLAPRRAWAAFGCIAANGRRDLAPYSFFNAVSDKPPMVLFSSAGLVSVECVYIDDRFINGGTVDTGAMQPIAWMGYIEYSVVRADTVFKMNRPEVASDGQTVTVPAAWDGSYR